jgi:hypothetical protein
MFEPLDLPLHAAHSLNSKLFQQHLRKQQLVLFLVEQQFVSRDQLELCRVDQLPQFFHCCHQFRFTKYIIRN